MENISMKKKPLNKIIYILRLINAFVLNLAAGQESKFSNCLYTYNISARTYVQKTQVEFYDILFAHFSRCCCIK